MSQKTYSVVTGLIFLVVALVHIARLAAGWQAVIAGFTVPMWISWVAGVVAGYLAIEGMRLSRRL